MTTTIIWHKISSIPRWEYLYLDQTIFICAVTSYEVSTTRKGTLGKEKVRHLPSTGYHTNSFQVDYQTRSRVYARYFNVINRFYARLTGIHGIVCETQWLLVVIMKGTLEPPHP